MTVGPTSTASYTVGINSIAGFSGPITLIASGLPAGAAYSFSPATINSSGTTTLSITPAAASPTGNFPITISAQGSSALFSANVLLVVGQPSPAKLISPPPGAQVSNGSITFTWDAGVGATQYTLTVGSQPGLSDIYAGGATTARSATFTLNTTATTIYVALSSNCPGPNPVNNYPLPVGGSSGQGPQAYPGTISGYTYSVPNGGSTVTLPFCLALSEGGACDSTVLPAVALELYSCDVTTNGQYPGTPAPGMAITNLNPYDPNYSAAFDVTFTATSTPPGTYYVQCFFNNAAPVSALWSIQVSDALPVVSYFQEYPANPDGSFYATIWGHNFGPDPGTLQVCIQAGCSDGQMNVCLSAACGNAYYVWSDQQINALIQPAGTWVK